MTTDIGGLVGRLRGAILHAEGRTRLSGYKTEDMGVARKPPKPVEIPQPFAHELANALLSLQADLEAVRGEAAVAAHCREQAVEFAKQRDAESDTSTRTLAALHSARAEAARYREKLGKLIGNLEHDGSLDDLDGYTREALDEARALFAALSPTEEKS